VENKTIKGFSKLSKEAKIEWLTKEYLEGDDASIELLKSYWHNDTKTQKLHDEFIENTLTNFYLPFGVAPNFMINDKVYCIPMAIEESSVVAAAAKSASFWLNRGGFKAQVISTIKVGHVHFAWYGEYERLLDFFTRVKDKFFQNTENLTANMRARGGGILDIQLVNKCELEPNYYQLMAKFETCDSMGANFINSLLEEFSKTLSTEIENDTILTDEEKKIQVIMCILSNYTPECLVRSEVSCKVEELTEGTDMSPELFIEKFVQAIHVATIEPYRATTHNKGIFNGIDSVVLATGNDFRAVEACGHTYAAKDGQYKSLTHVSVENGIFRLMMITATAGLAQNFGAIRSLVTTGIQKGHMKMHLLNILNQLEATDSEKKQIVELFKTKTVTYKGVVDEFCRIRGIENKDISIGK